MKGAAGSTNSPSPCRIGVDIGGTFTDIVVTWSDGRFVTQKVPSTPNDYSEAIVEGLSPLLEEFKIPSSTVEQVIHGTTVATNAILSRRGARTALITTRGFRDVLELRRIRIPKLYDLFFERPEPLVPRRYRFEVDERVDAKGNVLRSLNEAQLRVVIDRIKGEGVDSVAVCLLNSFRHPGHEIRVGELVRESLPGTYLSLSVDVLPEIREYERTSTTVINSYIGPIVKHYLQSLLSRLKSINLGAPVLLMQSNGGIMSTKAAIETPANLVESGPAAGVVAATRLAGVTGYRNLISFDMGGTTAKAAMVENGEMSYSTEAEVGGGITLSSRLIKGGGYALKLPMIDLSEVGAGGGSIARVDRFGVLKIGPDSAGADPGPVCYDRGGIEPTLTDGDVVLGYINPEFLAGGSVRLNSKKAYEVIQSRVAEPMGKTVHDAAYGMYAIANSTMIRAIKAVSTYRGRDPREFALLAFGGSGPIHAAEMARSLGIRQVIVPISPGLFSAIGLLVADIEYRGVRTFIRGTAEVTANELNDLLSAMTEEAKEQLAEAGYGGRELEHRQFADMRYEGQAFELTVPLPDGRLAESDIRELDELFSTEHQRTYGHRALHEPVEIINLRVVTQKRLGEQRILEPKTMLSEKRGRFGGADSTRRAYFGPGHSFQETRVVTRRDLQNETLAGPLIVEEYDATVVVPPSSDATLDPWGNIVITLEAKS